MPTYTFAYTTNKPEAELNGSENTAWFIIPQAKPDGGSWEPVLGTDKMFYVRADELAVVNAIPHGTGPELAAKSNAYIALILGSKDNTNVKYVGWLEEDLQQIVVNNDLAIETAAYVDDFITNVMGLTYPVLFPVP